MKTYNHNGGVKCDRVICSQCSYSLFVFWKKKRCWKLVILTFSLTVEWMFVMFVVLLKVVSREENGHQYSKASDTKKEGGRESPREWEPLISLFSLSLILVTIQRMISSNPSILALSSFSILSILPLSLSDCRYHAERWRERDGIVGVDEQRVKNDGERKDLF